MKNIWYFRLETIGSRYTKHLCEYWMPDAFRWAIHDSRSEISLRVLGHDREVPIKQGCVLDACGRGKYSGLQVQEFLTRIEEGEITKDDVIFLQDYWTPGIEAVMYALHLHNLPLPIYAMCHAQSVDRFDFTRAMLPWIRHYEKGLDSWMCSFGGATFVASDVHRKELRAAGFKAPVHVVGLPIDYEDLWHYTSKLSAWDKDFKQQVIFCSRMDKEKNPEFMLQVADLFLRAFPGWTWAVTTSAENFGPYGERAIAQCECKLRERLRILRGLSKKEYYQELKASAIQFNCSSQDYVSWTLLEACTLGCDICYPDYRSFKECVPEHRRYRHLNLKSALALLAKLTVKGNRETFNNIPMRCSSGRLKEAEIVVTCRRDESEYNVWQDKGA